MVNKTGYKRNGKGKKKRARKEIEINSPKKKKVELMHIREKQRRCLGTGQKVYGGGVGRSREGMGHEVLSLVQGVGRAIFSYPQGVGHPIFY